MDSPSVGAPRRNNPIMALPETGDQFSNPPRRNAAVSATTITLTPPV